MLVERSVYDQAVEMAAQVASSVAVAPAAQTGDHIGPVVSKRQWDQIQSYIQSGIDEGARLVTGGLGLPEGVNRGYFVRPTVFADVRPGMTIERQEIFGPVLTMMPFDSEEEAITIANDTPYGLTNYLQTQDADRIRRLSLKLKAGMIEVNGQGLAAGVFFGGIKDSGRAREGGVWGIEEFLESKAMSGWKKSA
jgi:aldehyde dehydrogenase (NAD+)